MAATPMYGQNALEFILNNQKADYLVTSYVALGMLTLRRLNKWWS